MFVNLFGKIFIERKLININNDEISQFSALKKKLFKKKQFEIKK